MTASNLDVQQFNWCTSVVASAQTFPLLNAAVGVEAAGDANAVVAFKQACSSTAVLTCCSCCSSW